MTSYDLVAHLYRQRDFSLKSFGPNVSTERLINHIKKELEEIQNAPIDLMEWIDVVILAFDGAHRAGHSPEDIANGLLNKQIINENRKWPDWKTLSDDEPINHIKDNN